MKKHLAFRKFSREGVCLVVGVFLRLSSRLLRLVQFNKLLKLSSFQVVFRRRRSDSPFLSRVVGLVQGFCH